MPIDATIHLGDLVVAGGVLISAWRVSWSLRSTLTNLQATVYGSKEPPVEGLVAKTARHDHELKHHRDLLGKMAPRTFFGKDRP